MLLRGVLLYLFKSLDIFLLPKCTKCPKGYVCLYIYMCVRLSNDFSSVYDLALPTLLNNMMYRHYSSTPFVFR